MTQLFQNTLTASFHGSIVILAVCFLRLMLKKTPKKFLCLLWMLAFARLLMPFEIQSSLSLQPEPEILVQEAVTSPEPDWLEAEPQIPEILPEQPEPVISENVYNVEAREEPPVLVTQIPEAAEENNLDWKSVIPLIWLSATACFALYCLVSYVALKLRVREAIRIPGGWECDRIETAFILGFVRPKIYIPMGLPASVRGHILAHERTHLEKGDHWYKMLGYIGLAVHWFNPLVWLAYILLCKDIELACDERVVQFMELNERKAYSAALLRCSTSKAHFAACPVAFGEVSVKERIVTVLKYRKPSFWISLLGILAIAFVVVCLMTSPTEKRAADRVAENSEELDGRMVVQVKDVDEFLAAIGPNTVIELAPGTYNLCEAANYGQETGTMYYSWVQCYDGYELTLFGVENLTISGSGRFVTTVETEPRYANVIKLTNCANVTCRDFTAGHTKERGECSGGVIRLEGCDNIDLSGLGLYGCGVTGLITDLCSNVKLTDSDIYECSTSALSLHATRDLEVSGCRIYDIGTTQYGGYSFFSATESSGLLISNCEISDSTVSHFLYASDSQMELRDNLFVDNRSKDGVFSIHGNIVVLEENLFRDNNIRSWYEGYGSFAVDRNGVRITEFTQVQTSIPEGEAARPQLEIHVSTVDEFLAAIGSNTEIVLDGDFYDLSTATGYGTFKGDNYYWEDIFDGPGLVICNVENMTIRSNDGDVKGHTISAVPRYADVLVFSACKNVTISGFTAGHTREPGSCAGGVIEFRDCDRMTVDNCGLFGCGILGVYAEYSSDIAVKNSDIYECSQGGVQFWETDGITLENNTFRDLGGTATNFIGCSSITIDGKLLNENTGGHVSVATASTDKNYSADMAALQETALDFAMAFVSGKKEDMQLYLASFYDDEIELFDGNRSAVTPTQAIVAEDYPEEMESKAWCISSVILEDQSGAVRGLTLEMCREQGIWKIQDYYWGNGEREALTAAVDNFVYAYFADDRDMMREFLTEGYTGTVAGYPGLTGTIDFLDHEIAEHRTNKSLETEASFVTAIPFKETPESKTVYKLILTLEKRDGVWKTADFAMEEEATVEEVTEDTQALEEAALAFAHAYLTGSTEEMKPYLSENYTGKVTAVSAGKEFTIYGYKPPIDIAQDLAEKGYCEYSLDVEAEDGSGHEVLMELIRENNDWKIRYYTMGQTEIELLDKDIYNFVEAYFHQDLKTMELLLADAYTRPVEVYFGDGNRVTPELYSVGDYFTNDQIAEMEEYNTSIGFKETETSDSYSFLSIRFERRENKQTYTEGKLTRTDSEWVVTDYGLEK